MTDLTFNIVALGDAFTKMIALGDSVERLGLKLDELSRKVATPKVDVDTTAANAKIDELNRKINPWLELIFRFSSSILAFAAVVSTSTFGVATLRLSSSSLRPRRSTESPNAIIFVNASPRATMLNVRSVIAHPR